MPDLGTAVLASALTLIGAVLIAIWAIFGRWPWRG